MSPGGLNSVGQGWDTGFWLSNKSPSCFQNVANQFETLLVTKDQDRAGAIITGGIHCVLALCVLPHQMNQAPSLTTRDSLTLRVNLWRLEALSLPKKLPVSFLSFVSASCEDSRVATLVWDWACLLALIFLSQFCPLFMAISSSYFLGAPYSGGGFYGLRWAQGLESDSDWDRCFLL